MPETKASPLALLAATCSSIGKTDAEKKDLKTTTTTPIILSKLTPSQETKRSSFKPYKNEDRKSPSQQHQQQQLPAKSAPMRSSPPILVSNSNIVSSKVSASSINTSHVRSSSAEIMHEKSALISPSRKDYDEYAKYQDRVTKDMKDKGYKKCSISPPLPHLPGKVPMMPHHHNHSDCTQCKPGHPHSGMIPSVPRHRSVPHHQCSCAMCHNRGVDPKCHYQSHPGGLPSIYHPSHKPTSLPPPPVMACRDPNCTNCAKLPSSKTLQNFVHPALVQQCTHNSSPLKSPYVPPPPPHSSYDSYFHKNGPNYPPKPKPHVCNWVADGKHCGSSFLTSEELYQHLRTHTSMQQQRNNDTTDTVPSNHPISISTQPPPPGVCTIHGCPCGGQRKSSPRNGGIPGYSYNPSVTSSLRYTPYGRPLSTGSNPGTGHSYPPHNLYHY